MLIGKASLGYPNAVKGCPLIYTSKNDFGKTYAFYNASRVLRTTGIRLLIAMLRRCAGIILGGGMIGVKD